MNSRWNDNLIIFAMEVVSTHFDDWVKIRVFRPHRESTPCQTWSKLPKIFMELGFDIKLWKMLFCENFNLVCPLVNLRLTRGILVILAEKGTLGAPMSEWVVPHHFGCPHGPMERKLYFWIFRVRHANRGRTKYGINSYPFFVWYLECNDRCQIKNMILYFVAPKLCAEAIQWLRPVFYLMRSSYCSCF